METCLLEVSFIVKYIQTVQIQQNKLCI